jgi:membrane protease YdiL (CAAX protease family)
MVVKSLIRSLPAQVEFCLVMGIAFGLAIVANAMVIFRHVSTHPVASARKDMPITNDGIVNAVVVQLVVLSIIFWIGRIRGWSFKSFGLQASWRLTASGVLLFFAFGLVGRVIRLFAALFDGSIDFHRVPRVSLPYVLLISAINPLFEESLECGYPFYALQSRGMWVTVLTTAVFRGFLHSTMGLSGFVFMFAMGLLYGFVYWRWRQLWPLIVAHGLQMLYSLLPEALAPYL